MSAEDYDDVPGFGGGVGFGGERAYSPSQYKCNHCSNPITFKQRKPFNQDGTPHRCLGRNAPNREQPPLTENGAVTLFAMGAMQAIVQGQIAAGGVDFIHHMNFYDVADAAWRLAVTMKNKEKEYRGDITEDHP